MTALVLAARYWWAGVIAILLAALALCHIHGKKVEGQLQASRAALSETVASYKLAAEKAKAADLANARATEQRYASIQQEHDRDLSTRLAAARADADAYAARLRAASAAHPSGSGVSHVSGPATPASGVAGADTSTELDDAHVCAENTVKAEGWRDWWKSVSVQ